MIWNKFQSYWSDTGTYEAIVPLINMDFDGLKTAIIEMLSGNSVEIDPTTFQNDMVNFTCRDDILTCLIIWDIWVMIRTLILHLFQTKKSVRNALKARC